MKRILLSLTAVGFLAVGLLADPPPTAQTGEPGTMQAGGMAKAAFSGLPSGSPPQSARTEPVSRDAVTRGLEELRETVEILDPATFASGYLQKTLVSRVSTAIHRLDQGRDAAARSQLRSILRTLDGCAALRRPDRNDWVLDCQTQEQLHRQVFQALASTENLM